MFKSRPIQSMNNLYKQRGVATILAALIILILMTLMLFYGTRVSIFEQRTSANEEQQKRAFNLAEAGRTFATSRMISESTLFDDDALWNACPDPVPAPTANDGLAACRVIAGLPAGSGWTGAEYYSPAPADGDPDAFEPAINTGGDDDLLRESDWQGETAASHALDVSVATVGSGLNRLVMVVSDATIGTASATVRDVLAAYDAGGGKPRVPLLVQAGINVGGGGTFDIVANPNGGGEGVPVSMWMGDEFTGTGNWATCEAYEFYRSIDRPADVKCTNNGGNKTCQCDTNNLLSDKSSWEAYKDGIDNGTAEPGAFSDIVDEDESLLNVDLFQEYFGVPKADYESVRGGMQIVNSCAGLGPTSSGNIWVDGTCDVKTATDETIGSPDTPVFLVVDGDFQANGGGNLGATVYGIVFITNASNPAGSSDLSMNGGAEVYGAVLVDHDVDRMNGNFAIVYDEDIINGATQNAALAPIPGGWSDTPWAAAGN